jgi:hypothetical protein
MQSPAVWWRMVWFGCVVGIVACAEGATAPIGATLEAAASDPPRQTEATPSARVDAGNVATAMSRTAKPDNAICRESDRDGDDSPDCADACPDDGRKTKPGPCGCGKTDTDKDHDGVLDCDDVCPADAKKQDDEGECGCNVAETDGDADGTPDCTDMCPENPDKNEAGDAGLDCNQGRMRLTTNAAEVDADLTDFPVMVRVTDAKLSASRADGLDLFFSSDAGATPLDFEIERWVQSTGELVAWVRLPLVSDLTDTVFYLSYGDGSETDRQNPAGVWDTGYQAIWHLANVSKLTDSKGGNAGTNSDTSNANGLIGGAAFFDSTDAISLPAAALNGVVGQKVSVSAWAYGGAALGTVANCFFSATSTIGTYVINAHLPWVESTPNIYWDAGNGTDACCGAVNRIYKATTATSEYKGQWNYYTFTKDPAAGTMRIYINGAQWHSGTGTTEALGTATNFTLGNSAAPGDAWPGTIDEFRVSNIERSAAWIAAEYNNQKSGATFLMIVED